MTILSKENINGKVILVKNIKGGVGKSWITLQLAHMFSLENKKVLIITSDSQNNVPLFAGIKVSGDEQGIEAWLTNNTGDYTKLRDNLYFISMNNPNIPGSLFHKFTTFMKIVKQSFDYIFIDASPVLSIDTEFVNNSDAVVIPTFLDAVSSQAITKMFKTVDLKKVKAIIPNRVSSRSKVEKEYYQKLANTLVKTEILLTCPIQQSAVIANLIDNGKTVWEVKNTKVAPFKKEFEKVREVIK